MLKEQRRWYMNFFGRTCGRVGSALILVLVFSPVFSQQWPFELWHEGKVVLSSGDTLKGLVKYDLQQDIVQFTRSDINAVVYSARKVVFFEIFDNTIHEYRQFFALPYSETGSYGSLEFFELLSEGKLTLLSKESLEYRSVPIGYYGGSYTRLVLVTRYFFMDDKGNINAFTGKKHDLLAMMGRSSDAVEDYIRANRLKLDEKADFKSIVSFYNSLHRI